MEFRGAVPPIGAPSAPVIMNNVQDVPAPHRRLCNQRKREREKGGGGGGGGSQTKPTLDPPIETLDQNSC